MGETFYKEEKRIMSNNTISVWKNNWNPLNEFQSELDAFFGDFTVPRYKLASDVFVKSLASEVQEDENRYLLTIEIPGVVKDDIKIEAMDNQIVVSGERKTEIVNGKRALLNSEIQYGKFSRSFAFSKKLDATQIEAQYQDGVLRVLIPKAENAKVKQIKISDGQGESFFSRLLNQTKEQKSSE